MIDTVLKFIRENSFLLGVFMSSTIYTWRFFGQVHNRMNRLEKNILKITGENDDLKRKLLELETKTIEELKKKIEDVIHTQNEQSKLIYAMNQSIENTASGVVRIENLLLARGFNKN